MSTATTERDLRAALARVTVLTTELDQSRDEVATLRRSVETLRKENVALRTELAQARIERGQALRNYDDLAARMAILEGKLARLGIGASTPPSKLPEPLKRQRPYPDKEATGRAPGGQPGHTGRTVARLEPIETTRHEPAGPCDCGAGPEDGQQISTVTRQVISVEVTTSAVDHVVVNRRCPCGALRRGTFPEGVNAPVSYDSSVKALTVGLAAGGQTPPRAVVQILADLTELSVSEASVIGWTNELAAGLGPFDAASLAALHESPAVAVDETPLRAQQAGGSTLYVHVAATPRVTRFHAGPRDADTASRSGRTKADIAAGGLVGHYDGVLVSDCYSAYFSLHDGAHQICLGHLGREAKWWAQDLTPVRTGAPVPDFAGVAAVLPDAIHNRADNSAALQLAVRGALAAMDGDTRRTSSKPRAYLNRLLRHDDKIFTFVHYGGVSRPRRTWPSRPSNR